MNDPKPYTSDDLNRYEVIPTEFRSYISGQRLIATVEALERAEKERDEARDAGVSTALGLAMRAEKAERELDASRNIVAEQREDADRCIAALTRERDEARAGAALLRIALENAEPIEAERDLLRAEVERLTRERDEALAKPRTVAEHLMSSYERVLLRRAEKAERERDEARADLARVAANRGELVLVVARTVEERDALKAALREMVECGEGCPACGDGRQGGCGCRYERAREALGEVE